MPEDIWETESALPDDFDFTITNAYFAPDAAYMNGEVLLLHLVGETDNPDRPQEHLMIPVGSGWKSLDGGATAVHERGKKKFVNTSVYGRVIDRCIELGMKDVFRRRGSPELGFAQASIWVGLKFHMKREMLEFGAGIKPVERLMPIAFLGEVGPSKEAKPAATPATTKPKAKATAPAPAEAPKPAAEEPPESDAELERKVLLMKLQALAKSCETYDDFYAKALKVPQVRDHDDLIAAIIDEEGGIWAQAHGS